MAKKDRWFFPTNTNNMRMIIAQGLVAAPEGFTKYYTDALELSPGWVPIFKNTIPPHILEKGISERANLTPCIMEFELKGVKGVAKIIKNNELVDIEIEDIGVDINKEVIDFFYILAPLPLSCISKILFKNNNDKKQFEDDAENRSNVILAGLKLQSNKTDQKLFNTESLLLDNPIIKEIHIDYKKIDYKKVYSFGGLLLTMFYFAKNGDNTSEIYHAVNELSDLPKFYENNIHLIYQYFKEPEKETGINPKEQMYNGLIDIAIKSKTFKEDIIEFLESDRWDEKNKKRTQNLANKLKTFEVIIDQTVSEQFKEAKTALEKVLLMLFFREDSEALMEYAYGIVSEEDYIQFAVMFGIRDKFSKVPTFIREFNGLQNFISYKMASYAHKQANIEMSFNSPQKPPTMMDMLKNNEFKKWFAKQLNIENCFNTKITIPNGNYKLENTNFGLNILFDGIVKAPIAEIKDYKYFNFISKYKFTEYNKYLKKYEKIK